MANAVKTPDGSLELPLREGAMYKQSGGSVNSGKRSRRRSVGEIVNKWDERYFVMTPRKLFYFKSETDFDSKKDPKGFLELSQFVLSLLNWHSFFWILTELVLRPNLDPMLTELHFHSDPD